MRISTTVRKRTQLMVYDVLEIQIPVIPVVLPSCYSLFVKLIYNCFIVLWFVCSMIQYLLAAIITNLIHCNGNMNNNDDIIVSMETMITYIHERFCR